MNPSLRVEINKPRSLAIAAGLISLSAGLAWIVASNALADRPLIHIAWINTSVLLAGAVASIYMPLSVGWHVYKAWRTDITESGVSQPQLRGNVQLRWSEVTSTSTRPQGAVELHYTGGKVVIASDLYKDPDGLRTLLLEKTNHAKRRTEA